MHLIGQFINVKRTNRNKADSILKPQGPHIKEVNKQRSDGNGIEWNSLPFPQIICNTFFKQQLKRLAKSRNRRYCCSPKNCCNMSHLDDSMAQYLEPSLGESDETDITPPRTPELRLDTDNDLMSDQVLLDHDMQNENTDTENSPPPSQPRPRDTNQQNIKSPQKKQSYNVPQKKELRKRDLKRKFTDQKPVANAAFVARKQKPVTRNPLKETHSANNIVHNDGRSAKTSFWLKRNCLYTCP